MKSFLNIVKNPNLWEHLQDFPIDFKRYSEYLLKAERICTLAGPSEEHAEDNDVIAAVRHHIEQICQYPNEHDTRFTMTIFSTGSTVEGTKVDRPDDFVICFEALSKHCAIKAINPTVCCFAIQR
jgi:hypothetical protein